MEGEERDCGQDYGKAADDTQHPAIESAGKYISAIYRHLQIAIAGELEPYRIGSGQYIFLITIAEREGITQKSLSEELLIDKTTTAKAVSKLEAEGYVKRVALQGDQRFNQLFLTEAGREILPKVKGKLRKLAGIYRQGMTDEEYGTLIVLLKRMLKNVCAEQRNKGGF
ncbi:MarR family winged helix-turn-helix transcriptional regulator [Paenibacillaceae bacterium WGS1546]|uniref:MarR family winged helix-turn-helix transcriptional regulator n=1 Tax=Cohnella sp. WGS1546 TaxID=3366810 RepID=UPI00372D6946